MRWNASCFSDSVRNLALLADSGRYQYAKNEKHTVKAPSRMKRYLQLSSLDLIWNTPKASSPENALAMLDAA